MSHKIFYLKMIDSTFKEPHFIDCYLGYLELIYDHYLAMFYKMYKVVRSKLWLLPTLSEKFTWHVTEKALDGKYSHCAGKFSGTMRVKDQIEYFLFDFSIFLFQNTTKLDWI